MKYMVKNRRQKGFTILELVVAMTMLSIVTLVVSVTIGQIYLNQKQITLRQDFHDEARLVMERIVQLVRNNTIDYDRYFKEVGPNTGSCSQFFNAQIDNTIFDNIDVNNDSGNRGTIDYSSIFYWDTKGDGIQDRHLGGALLNGDDDPCTEAFYNDGIGSQLYLINAERNIRTSVVLDDSSTPADTSDDTLELEIQYGADTDGDRVVDEWSSDVVWNDAATEGFKCELNVSGNPAVFGQPSTNDEGRVFCLGAHEAINILPGFVQINDLIFSPAPTADPFLAFRKASAQVHPHVYIDLRVVMRDHENYGFSPNNQPNTRLRTTASSRVFGDSRK